MQLENWKACNSGYLTKSSVQNNFELQNKYRNNWSYSFDTTHWDENVEMLYLSYCLKQGGWDTPSLFDTSRQWESAAYGSRKDDSQFQIKPLRNEMRPTPSTQYDKVFVKYVTYPTLLTFSAVLLFLTLLSAPLYSVSLFAPFQGWIRSPAYAAHV